jgi:hypothetical protein
MRSIRRQLAQYQQARRQEWMADTLHEVAVLEGRLMGALGLDEDALEAQVYGGEYLAPWEKQAALLKAAAEAGVA